MDLEAIVNQTLSEPPFSTEGLSGEEIELIKSLWVSAKSEAQELDVLLSLNNKPLCTRTGLSLVVGIPGSRKTFLHTLISSAILGGGDGYFEAKQNLRLLVLDTEQEEARCVRLKHRINKASAFDKLADPERFCIFRLRELGWKKRKEILPLLFSVSHPDFVVIDGTADLLHAPNNEEESVDLVDLVMELADFNKCHVLNVLHANLGDDLMKPRGHLGSNLFRKCELSLAVQPMGDFSQVTITKSRDPSLKGFAFGVDENGLPYYKGEISAPTQKEVSDRGMFFDILKDGRRVSKQELITDVIKWRANHGQPIGIDRAKKIVEKEVREERIHKDPSGYIYI